MAPARILLVEDEALLQMVAGEYLTEAGFAVDVAGSAAEALGKFGGDAGFAAVIVDVGLPDRRGDDLVAELRAHHPALPIVLATGYGGGEFQDLLKSDARITLLTKPYVAEDLLAALRAVGVAAPG